MRHTNVFMRVIGGAAAGELAMLGFKEVHEAIGNLLSLNPTQALLNEGLPFPWGALVANGALSFVMGYVGGRVAAALAKERARFAVALLLAFNLLLDVALVGMMPGFLTGSRMSAFFVITGVALVIGLLVVLARRPAPTIP